MADPPETELATAPDLSGMISLDDTLAGIEYGDLLAALQNDLQLNAATELLHGSVGIAMISDGLVNVATSATGGSATALPANPAGYLYFTDARGSIYKIPYYKA